MNPDTNRFESLTTTTPPGALEARYDALRLAMAGLTTSLYRPDGTVVPETWTKFSVGERVEIKGYTFEVTDIGEDRIVFKPVSLIVGGGA